MAQIRLPLNFWCNQSQQPLCATKSAALEFPFSAMLLSFQRYQRSVSTIVKEEPLSAVTLRKGISSPRSRSYHGKSKQQAEISCIAEGEKMVIVFLLSDSDAWATKAASTKAFRI